MGRTLVVAVGLLVAGVGGLSVLAAMVAFDVTAVSASTSVALLNEAALAFVMRGYGEVSGWAAISWLVWQAIVELCFAPVLAVALVGELVRATSLVWYAGATGILTTAMPTVVRLPSARDDGALANRSSVICFLVGVAAGAAYWLVAGRSSSTRGRPA